MEEDLIPQANQLDPLVAERFEDRPDLGERGVGLVEAEEVGHRGILARRGLRAHRKPATGPQ